MRKKMCKILDMIPGTNLKTKCRFNMIAPGTMIEVNRYPYGVTFKGLRYIH